MISKVFDINIRDSKESIRLWAYILATGLLLSSGVIANQPAFAVDPTSTPDVFEVSPAAGPAGTEIEITGDDFFGTTGSTLEVFFIESNGDDEEATIESATSTSILLEAPENLSGLVDVKIITPAGTVIINDAYRYRSELAKPTLTSVTPRTVSLSGYKQVVITGSRFIDVESVEFDGTDAISYRVESSTKIVAVVPPSTNSGEARIEVTNSADSSTSALNLTYAESCEIGDYLDVRFGYRSSSLSADDKGEIRAAVREMVLAECPAVTIHRYSAKLSSSSTQAHRSYVTLQRLRATTVGDLVKKRLTILGSTAVVRYAKFISQKSQASNTNWDSRKSYRKVILAHRGSNAPMVTNSYPRTGEISGGQVVTILGENLDQITGVKMGTTTASFSKVSENEIEVVTPARSSGLVDIVLTSATRTVNWEDAFRFVGVTEITDTNIDFSSIAGGLPITITGKNFYSLDNFDSLEFGGVPATSFVVVSPTQITAIVPANQAGETEITVNSAGGSADYEFTYRSAPKIDSVTPATAALGAVPANDVVIAGSNFASSVSVKVDGDSIGRIEDINNAGTSISIDKDEFPTSTSAGAVDVEVSTTGGKAILADGFEYGP